MRNGLRTIATAALTLALAPAAAEAAVTITPANLVRGESDGTATFTVTRDALAAVQSSTVTVTLDNDDTASCPADVSPCMRTITLGIAETSAPVSFDIAPDTLDEPDETIDARVTAATNDTPSPTPATLTILDDDLPPSVGVAPTASFTEGSGGTTVANLPVTLSAPSGRTVSVTYAVTAGTAAAGDDVSVAGGTVTVPAGMTSANVPLALVGDNIDELDETFTVTLSAPANATLANASSTVTIADDDLAALSISPTSVAEGTGGTPPVARFSVSLTTPSDRTISTAYATSSGSATQGIDFAEATGRLTFAPGETQKSFGVPIAPDAADEPDESFGVTLSDAGATTFAPSSSTGTILDDDAAPGAGLQPSTNVSFPGLGTSGAGTIMVPVGTDSTPPRSRITKLVFRKPNLLLATVTCPAPEIACAVQLTVFTRPMSRSRVPGLRRERRLVSKRATIPGGRSVVIRARISRTNMALLRRSPTKVGLRAFAVVRDAAQNIGTAARSGSIRP